MLILRFIYRECTEDCSPLTVSGRIWVVSTGSFRPGYFRSCFRVSQFGLFWWIVSVVSRFGCGSFRSMWGGVVYIRRPGPSINCFPPPPPKKNQEYQAFLNKCLKFCYMRSGSEVLSTRGTNLVPVKKCSAFLIHIANEIQLSPIYLLIACFDLRKIFLRI